MRRLFFPIILVLLASGSPAARADHAAEVLLQVHGPVIYLLKPGSDRPEVLVNSRRGGITSADWSPDGEQIAFTEGTCDVPIYPCPAVRWRIRVVRVRDGHVRTVENLAALHVGDIAWSPRGDHFAYHSIRAFTPTLPPFVVNEVHVLSTGGHHRFAANGMSPTWHPRGHRIAYANDAGLFISDLQGIAHRGTPIGFSVWFPRWSPDGRRIAFTGARHPYRDSQVWVVDGARHPRSYGLGYAGVDWRPDGGALATVADQADERIFVIDAATGSRRRLQVGARNPAWSPSAKHLAAQSDGFVHLVDPEHGAVEWSLHTGSLAPPRWRPGR